MSEQGSEHGDEKEMAATHWESDVDQEAPAIDVAAVVAELEGQNTTDLPPMVNHDDVFDALTASHRRQLLVNLLSSPQHVPEPSGISREVAEADENLLQRYLSSSRMIAEVDEYSVSMHHIHLPKLAEYGFIEWNQDDNLVVQGPRFDEIRPHLKLVAEHQD